MPSTRRNFDGLLAKVNFPLYTVQMLTSRHILVGGGGGAANTGVANGFEIFELSHNGRKFIVEEVIRHETGRRVVMNCSTYSSNTHSYLVAGQESHCQLYNVKSVLVENIEDKVEEVSDHSNVRRRKDSFKQQEKAADNNRNTKKLTFVLSPADSIQTDFVDEEPFQRVVRISKDGKFMATGGTDGFIRLWKFPSLKSSHTLKAHKNEIDDIDFSPCGNFLITTAKDGLAILWDYRTGKELRKLQWKFPEGSKYLFKRCRFGVIEGQDKKCAVYTISNPTGLAKKQKSYLQQWLPDSGSLHKVAIVDECLSALAVRDDGRFVAIGTMFSGSVSIYIAFSLQKALHISGVHSMFVTGLEFLPVAQDSHAITSISEAAVVSISVDNQVCIHSLPYRTTIPAWLAILIIVITLFLTFLFCSYIGI